MMFDCPQLDPDSRYNNLENIFTLIAASSDGRKSGSERIRCLKVLEEGSMLRARFFRSIMITTPGGWSEACTANHLQ
jgi:hypothetical protein